MMICAFSLLLIIQCYLAIVKSDIVNTFKLFGWFAVELILKNSGYSELRYEFLVIMNAF
jgi:hypothetical protein